MATVIYQQPFNFAGLELLLKGAESIYDKIISNRYKSEVGKLLSGYTEEKQAPVERQRPVGWEYKVDPEKEQMLQEEYMALKGEPMPKDLRGRSGEWTPTGMETISDTVPVPMSPEEIQQNRIKLLMGLEGAKAGLPAGMQTGNFDFLRPQPERLSLEDRILLKSIEPPSKRRSGIDKSNTERRQYANMLFKFYRDNWFLDEKGAKSALQLGKDLLKNMGKMLTEEDRKNAEKFAIGIEPEDSYKGITY